MERLNPIGTTYRATCVCSGGSAALIQNLSGLFNSRDSCGWQANRWGNVALGDKCKKCPRRSVSPAGSDALADCMCVAGHTGHEPKPETRNPELETRHGGPETPPYNC